MIQLRISLMTRLMIWSMRPPGTRFGYLSLEPLRTGAVLSFSGSYSLYRITQTMALDASSPAGIVW